jgi:uncharacterized protein
MKRAVILHGTDGSPEFIWMPWLKTELEKKGYEVFAPLLPENHTPNRNIYNDFLLKSGWDFTDNIIIGHSSGAVSVLNLLMDERCPTIKAGILVGVWAHMDGTELDREQFKDLFSEGGFDFDTIRVKARKLLYLHGDNDPFCPLDQAQWLADQTGSEIEIIPNGYHLGKSHSPEFAELLEALEQKIDL